MKFQVRSTLCNPDGAANDVKLVYGREVEFQKNIGAGRQIEAPVVLAV